MRSRVRIPTSRLGQALLLTAWVFAIAYLAWPDQVYSFPTWYWPNPQPWWWPYRRLSHVYSAKVVLLALLSTGLFAASVYATHKRWALLAVAAGCFCLNAGVIDLPGDPERHVARMLPNGHSHFFARAALHPQILHTLTEFETLVRDGDPATYARTKGPANLAYHVALFRFAQWGPIAEHLADASTLQPSPHIAVWKHLSQKYPRLTEHHGRQIHRALRVMPWVTSIERCLVCVMAFFWGLALWNLQYATIASIAAATVVAPLSEHLSLDRGLFPLLFALSLMLQTWAVARRSMTLFFAAGLSIALYFYFTIAALSCFATAACALALFAVCRPLRDFAFACRGGLVMTAGVFVGIALLSLALGFEPIERYRDALSIHVGWRGNEAAWRFAILNVVEFMFSSGPIIASLSTLTMAAGLHRLTQKRRLHMSTAFTIAIAMSIGMTAAFGSVAEVYRLWGFFAVGLSIVMQRGAAAAGLMHSTGARLVYAGLLCTWCWMGLDRFGHY
ncbi:MAG: hypothetical protein AAF550_09005 [Myxococcota bacterium]